MFGYKCLVVVVTAVSLSWNIERTRSQSSNEQHVVCSDDFQLVARNRVLAITAEQYEKFDKVTQADCQELCVNTTVTVRGKPCKSYTSAGSSCYLNNINSTEVGMSDASTRTVIMDRLCSVCEFQNITHNEVLVLTRDQYIWRWGINSALECQKLCTRRYAGIDCKSVTYYSGREGCALNRVNSSEAAWKPKPPNSGGDTDVYDLHCRQ